MTRRYGRPGAILWLGAVVALLGAASGCGDDDGGDDAQNGTGGALTGGKSGAGGASGGGTSASGGSSSGATSRGGSGGASGGSTSGSGGAAPGAGEGGMPAEGGGGAGPMAGNPGGGAGGDAGSGAMAGAPNAGEGGAGQAGDGGRPSGGSGGSAGGSDGGSGGAGPSVPVEYRSCESGAAVTRVELFRIDRANETCTMIIVQQGQINCLDDDLKSGGWCVVRAAISDDVEACEALEVPSNPVEATGGEGTFTVSTQPLAIDIDAVFDFPASGSLPQSVSVEADNCLADCLANDCRP